MHNRLFIIITILFLSKTIVPQEIPKYLDHKLSFEERVDDLISRMTIEEKISQMVHKSPAIERLGIPAYNWWNESLHGIARNGLATVFPMPIGLAATWDKDLMYKIGELISTEARAKYNIAVRKKQFGSCGLTLWAPNINIFRDPRWGRGMETYGEDPFLTGELAVQYIKGLHGNDEKYFKTIATPKHFAVHSGPESERHHFNAIVSEYDLRNTYLPHFKKCIEEGNVQSLMCAYNRVLGEPCCGSNLLLKKILRDEWKFNGLVVSDCWAVHDIFNSHHVTKTLEDAVVLSLIAGTELECGNSYHLLYDSFKKGIINEEIINEAVKKIFLIRFKLGLFDPPELVPYSNLTEKDIDTPQNKQLALEAARKSIVLLKNDNNLLPLKRNYKTIAIIGPNADNLESLLGNYFGFPSNPVTPLKAFQTRMSNTKILYEKGCYFAENIPSFDLISSKYLYTTIDKKQNGLIGKYYSNTKMEGNPEFIRIDNEINFSWLDKSPVTNSDTFSIVWIGYILPPVTGKYALGGYGYNGFKIYLNDSLLVKYHGEFDPEIKYNFIELKKDSVYKIKVELYKKERYSFMKLLWSLPEDYMEENALRIAKESELIIMFMGLSPRLEGEALQTESKEFKGGDRLTLNLPEVQLNFIKKIYNTGKPIVLVLFNGGPLTINWENEHIPAIIEAWYPGQAGGDAIYDIITGIYNPSGKLPVTFYYSLDELPEFSDYNMSNRTYRYYKNKILYPFGYGLSYSSFTLGNPEIKVKPNSNDINLFLNVNNKGPYDGEETIQLYVKYPEDSYEEKSLIGFKKVYLKAKEKKKVEISIDKKLLTRWTEKDGYNFQKGEYIFMIGTSSDNKKIIEKNVYID
ncbi:glycoside hydrolase family 3 C-terminal domain-containing protein [Rosettibacter firmus]|uniref:glycoside hydrolase family 3 C-terminal domain-containing protein n=1 Tax=Rosettibacter firmus TaxID=3111522 RepID=UPI00336BCEAD